MLQWFDQAEPPAVRVDHVDVVPKAAQGCAAQPLGDNLRRGLRALVRETGFRMGLRPDVDMRRVLHPLQQRVLNPVVRLAWAWRLPIPGDALLETIGRRTGRPRHTPVCDGLDGDVFWLVSQRGRDADWVRNLETNPRVRVKVRGGPFARWRNGTAHIVDGDDPRERQRMLARANLARRLCVSTSQAIDTNPLTVRVDLDPL